MYIEFTAQNEYNLGQEVQSKMSVDVFSSNGDVEMCDLEQCSNRAKDRAHSREGHLLTHSCLNMELLHL